MHMVRLLTLKVWLTKASKLGFGMQWDGVSTGVRAADLAAAAAALRQSPCTAGTLGTTDVNGIMYRCSATALSVGVSCAEFAAAAAALRQGAACKRHI